MESIFDQLRQFSFPSMMLRVLLAMLMGGIVGFEREKKRRPAGFRTYMLVALGAAMTVMLSQYLDYMLNHQWLATASRIGIKTDVSRFGAQVINGVGFLGGHHHRHRPSGGQGPHHCRRAVGLGLHGPCHRRGLL